MGKYSWIMIYFFIIDRIFSTHARALDFYTRLMGDKWTERFDREDIPFDSIIGQMQQAPVPANIA